MPQTTSLNEIVDMLEEATKNGSVKWVPGEEETESFSARLESGAVRISWFIVGSTYLLEMLDTQGHTMERVEATPQLVRNQADKTNYELLERLFRCARTQAIRAEVKMGAMIDELRKLAGQGSRVES